MFCANCGKFLNDDAKFCAYCGSPVKRVEIKPVKPEKAFVPPPMWEPVPLSPSQPETAPGIEIGKTVALKEEEKIPAAEEAVPVTEIGETVALKEKEEIPVAEEAVPVTEIGETVALKEEIPAAEETVPVTEIEETVALKEEPEIPEPQEPTPVTAFGETVILKAPPEEEQISMAEDPVKQPFQQEVDVEPQPEIPEPEQPAQDSAFVQPPAWEAAPEQPAQDTGFVQPPQWEPSPELQAAPPAEAEPVKKKKKWWIWVIVAAAVLLIAAGAVVFIMFNNLKKNYEHANELFANGEYEQAAAAFDELGTYNDSQAMAELSRKWDTAIDDENKAGTDPSAWDRAGNSYEMIGDDASAKEAAVRCHNMAKYYTGEELFESSGGNADTVLEAKKMFESCGGVLDSASMITECENELVYIQGTDLIAQENWAEAETVLAGIDADYKDTELLVKECQDEQLYAQGKSLMAEKKWAEAEDIFNTLSDEGFKDTFELREECLDWQVFEEASALLAEGHFYDAYKTFDGILGAEHEGMPDIYGQMEACIQPLPASGEVYHNPAYTNNSVELTIDNTGFKNSFVKLYIGDDLVSSIFIVEEGVATVWLPTGTYRMNKGYGDMWFGTEDLFGDEGRYWKCTFGDSETFTLEAGYSYEISSGGEGTSIYDDATDRDSM